MRGISVNDDGSHEDHGDILSREMKSRTHSVKVSLLIVQVPVQTERLNPRGTNPARKSLSHCTFRSVPFCPVYRVYAYASYFLLLSRVCVDVDTRTLIQRDSDAISHSNAGQEASASLVHLPGTVFRSLPPHFYPLSLSPHSCALIFALEDPKKDA